MVKVKAKTYILLCCIVLCAIFFSAAWLLANEHFDTLPSIEGESEYILHEAELVPRENITSFIVDNGNIYIYYDKAALINVYGTDGSFKYGIQISTIQNGHGDIAVSDEKLYIDSRLPIIFVFQDDQMIDSIVPDSSSEKYISARALFSAEKNTVEGKCKYQLTASKQDIIRQDTQEPVIELPHKSYLAEHLLLAGLILLSLSLVGYEKLFRK